MRRLRGLRRALALVGLLGWTGGAARATTPQAPDPLPELPPELDLPEEAEQAGQGIPELERLHDRLVQVSTKTEKTIDDAPNIVAVITRKEIAASGARTLGDIIRMVPGYDSGKVGIGLGDPVDSFLPRGIKSDFSQTTLILLNGRNKLNDLVFASPWISTRVSVDMIERLEVIRGPGSALYGGSAFAGVINIITRDVAAPDGVDLSVGYGHPGELTGHGLVKGTLAGFTIGAQGRFFVERGRSYESLRLDNTYRDDQYEPDVAQGNYREIPEHARVTDGIRPSFDASVSVSAPHRMAHLQLWHTDHNPHPFLTGFYPTPALDQYGNHSTQTLANLEVNPTRSLTLGAYFSYMTRDASDLLSPVHQVQALRIRTRARRGIDYDPANPDTRLAPYGPEDIFQTRQRNDDLGADANYRLELGSHSLLVGGSFVRESQFGARASFFGRYRDPTLPPARIDATDTQGRYAGLLAYQDHVRLSGAGYLQDQWQALESLGLTLGLRYDRYQDIDDSFILTPRAAVVWRPAQQRIVKAIYSQGFRPPSGFEQFGIFSGSSRGNPAIKPETIRTGELAYVHYLELVRIAVSGYVSAVSDTIVAVEDGDVTRPNQFRNLGEVRVLGGELELLGTSWWLNYSYIRSSSSSFENGPTGVVVGPLVETPFVASHLANGGIECEIARDLRLSSQLYLRSPRKVPPPTRPIEDAAGLVFVRPTDWLVQWDAKVRYAFRGFELFARVNNILGREYRFPLNDDGQYAAPGRAQEIMAGIAFRSRVTKEGP